MRHFIVSLLLFFSTLTQAQVVPFILQPSQLGVVLTVGQWVYNGIDKVYYIEVIGEGSTIEESKLNGFRLAVEQAVGSVIASETEVNNSRISRDEIISYASGYVDRFEIVSQTPSAVGYKTDMKVWIKRSSISNRLLHTSQTPQEIDGEKAAVSLTTLQHEREQGDRLVYAVVNDFYRMGMNIQSKPINVIFDDRRNGVLAIPFILSWNENYLDSLWESLKSTSQDKQAHICISATCNSMSTISIPKPFRFSRTIGFSDSYKIDKIINVMIDTKPTILMTLYGIDNRVLYTECYKVDQLDHSSGFDVPGAEYFIDSKYYGPRNLVFNSNLKLEQTINLTLTPRQLQMINRVDLKVVPRNKCSK